MLMMLLTGFVIIYDKKNPVLYWTWSVLAIIAFVLNVPILRLARCPKCNKSLVEGDSPFRLLPIFLILIGRNPVCKKCLSKIE